MRAKTKAAKTKSNLKRTQAITAAIKSLEKTGKKLELDIRTLKKDLVVFRWFRS
jgi:flagellar capping protein FliD